MWILLSKHKAYEHEDHDRIHREQGVRALPGRRAAWTSARHQEEPPCRSDRVLSGLGGADQALDDVLANGGGLDNDLDLGAEEHVMDE